MGKKVTMQKWVLSALSALFALAVLGTAAAETVKVGVIQTLSGPFARWGEQTKQAIEVFQKQHGKAVKGNEIQIVYRDDGGPDPARAKQLAEELVLKEKVQFLAGFAFTPNALAVAEIATEAKVPTVIMNAATGVVTRKSPYFVRTSFTLPQATAPVAEWAAKNGIKSVVTLVTDYAPGQDAEAAFVKVFKANGGNVLESIRVPLPTTDFAPFFERVLAKKPDALFLFGPGGPSSVGMINTWAARLKPAKIQLITTTETQEIDLARIGPAAIDAIGSSHYPETSDNPLNISLRKDLESLFGPKAIPDIATVATYDGMQLIYRAVEKLGARPKPDAVMELWKGAKLDSPRGPIQIDAKTRDIVQNIYLRRVAQKGDKLVNVSFLTIPTVKDPWKEWNPE
jgi:branched-chain amino acid transport system substrate-binding protein